jgi:hypothetical protein
MATTLLCGFDPAQERNAFLAVRNRLEGVLTSGEPPVVEKNVLVLEVTLSDDVPAEQVSAAIRTLANLASRPESGITTAWTTIPANTEGLQRQYSV